MSQPLPPSSTPMYADSRPSTSTAAVQAAQESQAVPAGKKVHRCTKCAATFDSLLELGEHVLVEMNDGVTSPPFPYPRGYEPPAPVQPATQQPQPELPCDTPTEERPQSSFERPSMEPSQEEHLGPEKAPDAYAAVFPCPKCGDCFGTKEYLERHNRWKHRSSPCPYYSPSRFRVAAHKMNAHGRAAVRAPRVAEAPEGVPGGPLGRARAGKVPRVRPWRMPLPACAEPAQAREPHECRLSERLDKGLTKSHQQ